MNALGDLKYIVCIKPVPDPSCYDRVSIDPVSKTLIRDKLPMVINPADKHAIEAALQLRDKTGGQVILVSMAPPGARETIKEGLAMGADEAYLLSDKAFAGSDTLATARVLAAGIKKLGSYSTSYSIILTGNASADGGTTHVPAQLGVMLELPHVSNVEEIILADNNELTISSRFERGYIKYKGFPPLVLGVSKRLNTPRYTTVMGIIAAQAKTLLTLSAEELGLQPESVGLTGSPTKPGNIYQPQLNRKSERIAGSPEEVVGKLIAIMRAAGVVNG